MEKGNRKIINAWAMYDWANSVYPLVINTAIFPIYYGMTVGQEVAIFGMQLKSAALYSFALAISYMAVAILTPLLSGVADYSGNKKRFMQIFCYIGALSCAGLYLFSQENLLLGLLFVITASIGWGGSIVFYNAFLPEIAEPKDHDRISAKGYSLGYIGSVILLIFNLSMVLMPDLYFDVETFTTGFLAANPGADEAAISSAIQEEFFPKAARISFITVCIWWVGFAQITFWGLPNNVFGRKPTGNIWKKGFLELKNVWDEFSGKKRIKRYLASFFVYSMGVQTVMLMATLFGEQEVDMSQSELITTLLVIQLIAIPGAYGFSWISSKLGNFRTLEIALFIWVLICAGAYLVYTATQFYIIAAVVGLVMGGIQSLSRSTYSKLLPNTMDHASYFSFFDVCEKVGVVIGMVSYGYLVQILGTMRAAIFSLILFFVIGFILLRLVGPPRADSQEA